MSITSIRFQMTPSALGDTATEADLAAWNSFVRERLAVEYPDADVTFERNVNGWTHIFSDLDDDEAAQDEHYECNEAIGRMTEAFWAQYTPAPGHAHTCLDCGAVIETSADFDCEMERDHDSALCDECASIEPDEDDDRSSWPDEERS